MARADGLLSVRGLTKRYPGVTALDAVDFSLDPGEVHVLFGENGAGKSTLISILAGAKTASEGHIFFRGEEVRLSSVHDARERGISAVFQEFSLVPQMSVAENLFLGAEKTVRGFLAKRTLRSEAQDILDRLDFPLSPSARVDTLTRAEQQMVEIAKAFRSDLSVLILDEPTASLTARETEQLFELVARLKADGVGMIYITHRMQEIRRIADRITVLRDGKYVATVPAETPENELIALMTGRDLSELFPTVNATPGAVRLAVQNVTTRGGSVKNASLEARAGEILGLSGLVGSGKSEVMRAVFGLEPITSGTVTLMGEDITGATAGEVMRRGLSYTPPDRRAEGLVMIRPAAENISLGALDTPQLRGRLGVHRAGEKRLTTDLATRMELRPNRPDRPAEAFSGGNQQKVLLAKSLTRDTSVFVFDEPTVGVDVGTRAAIYRFIADLAEGGAAVILISSDLPEIVHLATRALVFYRGEIKAEVAGEAITEEALLSHFFERDAA